MRTTRPTSGEKTRVMRKKTYLINLYILVVSTVASLLLLSWVTETFFFDNFYYGKSLAHGYYGPGVSRSDLGRRGRDLLQLSQFVRVYKRNPSGGEQGSVEDDGVFTIALIGDSNVWGQGVRNRHRFAATLERKLNRISPTRIISLGSPGDNLIEHYLKYYWVKKLNPSIELVIFQIVDNDLLFNGDQTYDSELFHLIADSCSDKPFYLDPFYGNLDLNIPFPDHVAYSFDNENYGNYCVIEKLLSEYLPRDKALYFFLAKFWIFKHGRALKELFVREGFPVLDATEYIDEHYTYRTLDMFYVSERDRHPSKLANDLFAEFLFEQITADPSYGVVKSGSR